MNSHLPVGRLAEHLESLSRERAWFAIVAATTGVAAANFSFPAIGFAPLYMPVICGACWALGAREGYFVATVTAFLTAVPALHAPPELPPALLALRVAVRSEEHTSELQSLMRISYAVFCLKNKK